MKLRWFFTFLLSYPLLADVTITIYPVSKGLYDDLTIHESGITNYGINHTFLKCGNFEDAYPNNRRGFMAFDLSEIGIINSATMTVYYSQGYGQNFGDLFLYKITPDSTPGFQYNEPASYITTILTLNPPSGYFSCNITTNTSAGITNFFSIRATEGPFSKTGKRIGSAESALAYRTKIIIQGQYKRQQLLVTNNVITNGIYDDVYISKANVTNDNTTLLAGNPTSITGEDDRSFLAFFVPAVLIKEAILYIYYTTGGSESQYGAAHLYKLNLDAQPGFQYNESATYIQDIGIVGNEYSGWYTVDVTDWISKGQINAFSIRGDEGCHLTRKTFSSGESTNPPYLLIKKGYPPGTVFMLK